MSMNGGGTQSSGHHTNTHPGPFKWGHQHQELCVSVNISSAQLALSR